MGVLGVGVDTIEVARIADVLARRPRFAERCFTDTEREYCESKPYPPQHFAGRFAAKEAVGKALGIGMRRWREVEVVRGRGAPSVLMFGRMLQRAETMGVRTIHLSISHSQTDAVAIAVAET